MTATPQRWLADLPDPKSEAWKYTDLPSAVRALGPLTTASALITIASKSVDKPVDIPAGQKLDKPVNILVEGSAGKRSDGAISINVGANAEATIIERHRGDGALWSNTTLDITLAEGARLRHFRLPVYGTDAIHTQHTAITLARDATYEVFTLTTGAKLSRQEFHTRLTGPNAHCEINGVNLLSGTQHGDTTIRIEHNAPHCTSHQFYRSVLDDKARGVFQGKIYVDRVAQKTDGYQMSRALLLSPGAEMDTKPELEIYADDVKCSHGATVGQLDDQALFYLRSRGITRDEARRLLIGAFVGEVVDKIADEAVRAEVDSQVQAWLSR